MKIRVVEIDLFVHELLDAEAVIRAVTASQEPKAFDPDVTITTDDELPD